MRGGAPVFIFVVAMALLLVMWSLPFDSYSNLFFRSV